MYRIIKYMNDGPKKWDKIKKYFYDDLKTFKKMMKQHKKNNSAHKNFMRLVAEENQNGTWVVLEDWIS